MPLKVLSYNIWDGGGDRIPSIVAVIRAHAPDAVALIEANDPEAAGRLAGDLSMSMVLGEVANGHHVVWLSRLPIVGAENHRSPLLAKTLLEIEVRHERETWSLFATHLGSRHDVPKPVGEIPLILDVMGRRAGRPHLLVGDLNALRPDDPVGSPPPGVAKRGEAVDGTPRPALLPLLAAGYLDAYRALQPDLPGYTHPADAPWPRLDYVFLAPSLTGQLAACDVDAGPEAARASDHLPIWAELS